MKQNYFILTVVYLLLSIQNGFGQSDPYDAINRNLESHVESKLLWPWEDTDLIKGMRNAEISATYRLSFNDQHNSELAIDFSNFEKMVSAVYPREEVSGKFLAETLEKSISAEFKPVFEQANGENIFYMFSNGSKDQEEVYFLTSTKDNYELLYFKYKPNTREKDRLQFQIMNIFNN